MKITKNDNVIVERTDTKLDCFIQGGIVGHVTSYPLADVIQITGLKNRAAVEAADVSDWAPDYDYVRIGEVIQHNLGIGKIIRRGHLAF